jgi:hypothetical protein
MSAKKRGKRNENGANQFMGTKGGRAAEHMMKRRRRRKTSQRGESSRSSSTPDAPWPSVPLESTSARCWSRHWARSQLGTASSSSHPPKPR